MQRQAGNDSTFRHVPLRQIRVVGFGAIALLSALAPQESAAAETEYPHVVRLRYEAIDPKTGGNFTIWLDRETIRQGLDARLYPGAAYVQVSHITPSAGSPLLTIIE